ncbi:MAG: phosphoribosylformylglycinamidine synthase subunit PurL [Actinomycetia bacterium]|nr:phosphoribosylformylglycinamidine synthase subunit PurL [Actinomycetota bacterium]MBU4302109.1 phosphoribosylformylglycinamidine synthase subunit PurL [Actinomycetota bacterium]MCG2794319.1 phosphoribosylformylglycinamidine synthase subunit PurL [Actinomycetes bacterium]
MPELYEELGLTSEEYKRIVETLGREPNKVELGMYSVMWSEHCSYKSSKEQLGKLPTTGPAVLLGPGENAGVVDIGDGMAVVFKLESHNHPSAVEPFQGAATGVGGIVRDIFTMGARPIACLDPLRFGSLESARTRYLFEGVVAGIAAYGNCLGIPTVAGDIYFEEAYEENPLVNVMCLGVMPVEQLIQGRASKPGSVGVLMGSSTGRDGIGGVSVLASQEFDETSEQKRPSVQVGDPFTEKLLIEVCLEMLEQDLLLGLQDFGGAGLTCATCETAERGGCGMDVDISRVPLREPGMEPIEIMMSESQERMFAICSEENLEDVLSICRKWGVDATSVGRVTEGDTLRLLMDGEVIAEVPASSLACGPEYHRAACQPAYLDEVATFDTSTLQPPEDLGKALLELLGSANICSRRWVYEQYDHMVRVNTVILPGSDAAVLRIKPLEKGIALSCDCNGRYCYLDPYVGAQIAVAESGRNVACTGARPVAVTNCLNFGNPEKPGIFWQFCRCVEGLAEGCRQLETPVVGGNVSFYNESFGEAIYPTPVIGMLGLLDDVADRVGSSFAADGDHIVLLGQTGDELGGSEYLKVLHGTVAGRPPAVDWAAEKALVECLTRAASARLLSSAHDLSEGGLAVALAESCLQGDIGASVEIPGGLPPHVAAFSESQSRALVSVKRENLSALEEIAGEAGVPVQVIGTTGGDRLEAAGAFSLTLSEMKSTYEEALEQMIAGAHH